MRECLLEATPTRPLTLSLVAVGQKYVPRFNVWTDRRSHQIGFNFRTGNEKKGQENAETFGSSFNVTLKLHLRHFKLQGEYQVVQKYLNEVPVRSLAAFSSREMTESKFTHTIM